MKNAERIQTISDEGLLKRLEKIGCAYMSYDRWRAWMGKRRTKRKPRRKNEAQLHVSNTMFCGKF